MCILKWIFGTKERSVLYSPKEMQRDHCVLRNGDNYFTFNNLACNVPLCKRGNDANAESLGITKETSMTPQEIEEVILAKREGKQIQVRYIGADNIWIDADTPQWNFAEMEYRVKSETKIRPYSSAEEFLEDFLKHGPYLKRKINGAYEIAMYATRNGIQVVFDSYPYGGLPDVFTWQDGHPCGIIEE